MLIVSLKKLSSVLYIVSGRFVDLHLDLLKKVSSGKTVERDQFVSSMTKVKIKLKLFFPLK